MLVFQRLDRLARSMHELLEIADLCNVYKVDMLTVDGPIDTTTHIGRVFFLVMGVLAEFESSLIGERVRAGLAAARARGEEVWRPSLPRETREGIAKLRNDGLSYSQISERLGVSKTAAHKYGRKSSCKEKDEQSAGSD